MKPDGTIDLTDGIRTRDRGLGQTCDHVGLFRFSTWDPDESAALDKIMKETLKEGYKYIPDVGGMAHPMANQWDDGSNPIDQLDKLMKIRRHLLDIFSEKAIRQDAPMATLEEVLVPVYLLHPLPGGGRCQITWRPLFHPRRQERWTGAYKYGRCGSSMAGIRRADEHDHTRCPGPARNADPEDYRPVPPAFLPASRPSAVIPAQPSIRSPSPKPLPPIPCPTC